MTTFEHRLVTVVDHSSLFIVDYVSACVDARFDWSNGLCYSGGGGVVILTGIYMGPVGVIWTFAESPPLIDLEEWEDAAIVAVTPPGDSLVISGFAGWDEPMWESPYPNTIPGPGEYMVRCCARGRDAARHAVTKIDAPPVEEYRVDLWPQRPGDSPMKLKATSDLARYHVGQNV